MANKSIYQNSLSMFRNNKLNNDELCMLDKGQRKKNPK